MLDYILPAGVQVFWNFQFSVVVSISPLTLALTNGQLVNDRYETCNTSNGSFKLLLTSPSGISRPPLPIKGTLVALRVHFYTWTRQEAGIHATSNKL